MKKSSREQRRVSHQTGPAEYRTHETEWLPVLSHQSTSEAEFDRAETPVDLEMHRNLPVLELGSYNETRTPIPVEEVETSIFEEKKRQHSNRNSP